MEEKIVIVDFGSQYTQLIARKVRELNVYCEIYPYNKIPDNLITVKGVILSGSPFSVKDKNSPAPDIQCIRNNSPLLGICYGAQYIAHISGGEVEPSRQREYGRASLSYIDSSSPLLEGLKSNTQVWMSHGDTIINIPDSFKIIGSTDDVNVGAYKIDNEETYGLQFHPEVYHSTDGLKILENFINL